MRKTIPIILLAALGFLAGRWALTWRRSAALDGSQNASLGVPGGQELITALLCNLEEACEIVRSTESEVRSRSEADGITRVEMAARASDPGVATDAEWAAFPRVGGSLATTLAGLNPQSLQPARLYRYKPLNPRDNYIPPAKRAELDALLESMKPTLESGWQRRMSLYFKEMTTAIEAGRAPADITTRERTIVRPDGTSATLAGVSARQLRERGADMVQIRNGQVYAAARRDFPLSRQALELERFLEVELGAAVVSWFVSAGTLEAHEAEQLRQSLAAAVGR